MAKNYNVVQQLHLIFLVNFNSCSSQVTEDHHLFQQTEISEMLKLKLKKKK